MSNQPAVIGPDGVARPYIGGQALIEGVMMRSPHAFAAVVRRQNGELTVLEEPMQDVRRGKLAWPLVRGVAALVEALKLGSRALRFSAEIYERDLEAEEAKAAGTGVGSAGKGASGTSVAETAGVKKPPAPSTLAALSLPIIALVTNEPEAPRPLEEKKGGNPLMTFLSIAFALGLFVALPQAFANGISWLFGLNLDIRSFAFQGLTGAAKIVIVIGYMLAIRKIPEIYRVFQYHGAEHKSIYTYESGEALTVENARKKTTLHPRCGTTFIVMVALVSILVFTAIGPFLPQFGLGRLADNVLFFFLKLPFLPFIAAITFELQRFLARRSKSPLRVLLWPGFLVQKITTIEPTDEQLEVAMGALAVTLGREKQPEREAVKQQQSYPDYAELLAQNAPARA